MIFNIQRCSIHDGHGLRTLVFFKGCPLRCQWCANPESQGYGPEIMESQGKCIGCGACVKVCLDSAINTTEEGFRIDREKCVHCFNCVDRCYAGSKHQIGKEYDVEELYKEIEKDRDFYAIKGGGVTFSGGEPLTHPRDLTAIAKVCHERGIDVAIESCGMGSYDDFSHALPYINSMFFDIKHIDSDTHKELTGSGNKLILDNLKRIVKFGVPVTVRTPIIPGLNDSLANIKGIAEFVKALPEIKEYELLPYHQFGANKYNGLGRPYALETTEPPEDEKMRELVKAANTVFENQQTCFYTKDNQREVIK